MQVSNRRRASTGEADRESRPAAGGVVDIDARRMSGSDALHDREAKASPSSARSLRPPEALEEILPIGRGDAWPPVADGYRRRLGLHGDVDGRSLACVVERVLDQIAQRLVQGIVI